jgi:hypothetical protein
MTDTNARPSNGSGSRGRGLVIAGAILVGLYLLPALALIAWFLWGLASSAQTMSMVLPFWLLALLVLTPVWIAGIALLGAGRAQQRGPVAGSVVAWVLALGGMPAIGFLLTATVSLLGTGQDAVASASFVALLISIPLLTVLALLSGAWLTWGRPRTT